ncbi:MAG TPA: hypothetical protein VND64_34560 [Pirellulales bacterium]|nr:hypothetical protein [Pirellulales bacterium]
MSASNRAPAPAIHPSDDEFPGYHPLSNMAVAGFVFGLVSILTFVSLNFSFIPLLGLACSVLALRHIAVLENAMKGRRFALAGLTLSLLFGLAAPTREAILFWRMRSESRELARQWFDELKQRQPYRAFQLELPIAVRSTPDKMAKHLSESTRRMQFEKSSNRPVVQALLTLGERAQVRFFERLPLADSPGPYDSNDVYAVTVEERGEKTTFFVELNMERLDSYVDGTSDFMIRSVKFLRAPPPSLSTAP